MATAVHERELKLDVGGDARLPSLAELPGVARVTDPTAHELMATYYDTPELRLLAHGVTLRHRTGGDDDGWHLKLPTPDGARDELQVRGEPDVVPEALVTAAGLYVRGADLAPVAEVRTARRLVSLLDADGHPLAEVCDDRVSARAPAPGTLLLADWREWEVELVDGPETLLAAAADTLRGAGAGPASGAKLARVLGDRLPPEQGPPESGPEVATVVGGRLREQLAELEYRDARVRRDLPDSVHKMRVATRRLRSALATFRPLLGRPRTEPIRDELKWLAGVLGAARDAQVMRTLVSGLLAEEPVELVLGAVDEQAAVQLTREYRLALERVAETLRSRRYHDLVDRLEALVAAPPWTKAAEGPPGRVLRRRVAKEVTRLRRRVADLPDPADREARDLALHEVRKAAKRVRYAAETVAPVHGKRARRLVKATKRVQTVLGDQHDAVVSQPLLRRLGVQAHLSGDNGFTYGLLLGRQRAAAVRLDEELGRAWQRVDRAKVVGWLE